MTEEMYQVRTPLFPTYGMVRQLTNILQGVSKKTVSKMIASLTNQMGTPQNPVDWSDPDTWISARLSGEYQELAQKIWIESQHQINPRHIRGGYYLINNYELLSQDVKKIYRLSERGELFLKQDPRTVLMIDEAEGIIQLLRIISTKNRAKSADLLPEWDAYLRAYSKNSSSTTIQETLRFRLANISDRELVQHENAAYALSQAGIDYLSRLTDCKK